MAAADMAYNPYRNDNNPGIWDYTKEILSPTSLLKYHFFMRPSTYSYSQGIKIPIGGGFFGRGGRTPFEAFDVMMRTSARAFHQKGFLAGAGTTLRGLKQNIFSGFWAGKSILDEASVAGGIKSDLTDFLYTQMKKNAADIFDLTEGAAHKYATRFSKSASRKIMGMQLGPGRRDVELANIFRQVQSKKRIAKLVGSKKLPLKQSALISKTHAFLKSKPAFTPGILSKARALRFGTIAGKGISWIGLGALAWDLTQAIGQPVGAWAIKSVDQALEKFNNRFQVEMGGELQMSYLSRGAATERQRALNAMSKSYINGRSAFGQEAQFSHK